MRDSRVVRVYKVKHINVYSDYDGHYIVHNTKKEFSEGHTHVNNYNTAKYLAYLTAYERKPKGHISDYLLQSLYRLAKTKSHIAKLDEYKDNRKKNKGKKIR